ncbi:hypothetical protein KDRO_D08350 [Kluyveromyces lactis]|nr:hypothetical protein KDRO_D08350 [Kluyveromyces lactis]
MYAIIHVPLNHSSQRAYSQHFKVQTTNKMPGDMTSSIPFTYNKEYQSTFAVIKLSHYENSIDNYKQIRTCPALLVGSSCSESDKQKGSLISYVLSVLPFEKRCFFCIRPVQLKKTTLKIIHRGTAFVQGLHQGPIDNFSHAKFNFNLITVEITILSQKLSTFQQ